MLLGVHDVRVRQLAFALATCSAALGLSGCGSAGVEDRAVALEREAARNAERAEISRLRAVLRKSRDDRLALGQSAPPKMDDPGFSLVRCTKINSLSVSEGFYIGPLVSGFGASVICANSSAGQGIRAWREWYCLGSERQYACVAGVWENGEPAFRIDDDCAGGYECTTRALFRDSNGKVISMPVTYKSY